ncbi:MAG TPA: long-chain fatty acid--CoA ligase [Streptosporangiaceae bacterium]|nr:long-chain fatty acid--CoA ligase [Streptosporangiaceae bacterium]
MQDDFPLTLQHVLDRMRTLNSDREVVTLRNADGTRTRASFGEVAQRVDRLAGALAAHGIGAGDRVATFAWNNQEHVELYMAIPCMGAVLHTLNIRLFSEQLVYVVNHAEDRIIFVDDSLVPVLEKVADRLTSVELFVVMGDGDAGALEPVVRYDQFLAGGEPITDYPVLDERAAAALCYTSGTTGSPKGVLYSHRSSLLHALSTGLADMLGVTSSDRVLPIVPQFHANAWGLVHGACLIGASLVMPGRFLQAASLVSLIAEEQVTLSGAVPTIFMDLLRYLDAHPEADLSSLRTVVCGGSAVPRALMEPLEERHGISLLQAWGMTETSPLASVAWPPADAEGEKRWSYRLSQGKIAPLVEARIVADDGSLVGWDGQSTGELQVRGPWIAAAYYGDEHGSAEKFQDGWLRTGDVASIDSRGFIRITDRTKDIIKSGGEWISSVELENELMAHPGVSEAAVIAISHERYTERPLGCVVTTGDLSAADLREHLRDRVAKWWIPESFAFVEEIPKTSVGKFDKKVLRRQLADGQLKLVSAAEPDVG